VTEISEVSTTGTSTFGRFGALISIIQIYANEDGGHLIMLIRLILFYVNFMVMSVELIMHSNVTPTKYIRSPQSPRKYITSPQSPEGLFRVHIPNTLGVRRVRGNTLRVRRVRKACFEYTSPIH
jgi:hypothetical protein